MDGGFVLKHLRDGKGEFPSAERILEYCHQLNAHERLVESRLLRIYFYAAPPVMDIVKRPVDGLEMDLSISKVRHQAEKLHHELAELSDVALRLGEVQNRGWKIGPRALRNLSRSPRELEGIDFVPDFVQKGVDLRIGLDIARLALRNFVSSIVLVTGDSDFIPAMKFARREGIRVMLDTMKQHPRHDLQVHADFYFGPTRSAAGA